MTEPLGSDDKSIRSYILNDVFSKKPINESFKDLCKVIGKDAITFYDFQFWYYRFLNGDHHLDFDRSSKPELQFSDLSTDAIGLIMDKVDVVGLLMLRRVSKPLRDFIEKRDVVCDSIRIRNKDNYIYCRYNGESIIYTKTGLDLKTDFAWEIPRSLLTFADNYRREAFTDLRWILKHPKLRIHSFDLVLSGYTGGEGNLSYSKYLKNIERLLKSLNHQITVENFKIRDNKPNGLLTILPYLKPRFLKSIDIDATKWPGHWKRNDQTINRFIKSMQWNMAQKIYLRYAFYLDFFPDDSLSHFKEVNIYEFNIYNPDILIRLRNIFAKSENFERCAFDTKDGFNTEYLERFIGVPGPPNKETQHVRHYMIPGSDKYLEFQFMKMQEAVYIEKKTR